MLLVIDNYDSFTWNLVDLLRRSKQVVRVIRNDEASVDDALAMQPAGLLISPGPGRPSDGGISLPLVKALAGKIPVLGICLGHQLLGEMLGAQLVHAAAPVHGKTSRVQHDGEGLFEGLPNPLRVMRYHSLLLDNIPAGSDVTVSARTAKGEIMGIRHKFLNFAGVQFHPESVLTEHGDALIRNWTRKVPGEAGSLSQPKSSR